MNKVDKNQQPQSPAADETKELRLVVMTEQDFEKLLKRSIDDAMQAVREQFLIIKPRLMAIAPSNAQEQDDNPF